ncbi:MAG: hypothetical protein LQ343_007958 [Gyalolechia ehrenbergii]|nr:MAG: hypothetical protein LQ343_007958 [Gyalolechia ehrenbergii]
MIDRGNAPQEWRDHLLNISTADFLLEEDQSVSLLQSAIANIQEGETDFTTAFARLATHFAVPVQESDLLRCLRATIQILVIHSIVYGDYRWITTSAIKEIERLSIRLRRALFKPLHQEISLEDGKVSMDICMHLASLLEKAALVQTLRGALIRQLNTLANLIPSALPFRHYNPDNANHIKNASNLLAKLHPDIHYVTGMAFALVMNPLPSTTRHQVAPPEYRTEKEAEVALIEI